MQGWNGARAQSPQPGSEADPTSDLLPRSITVLHFALLLPHSGHDLEGTTVGLAFVKSICSDTHSTGIIQVGFVLVYSTF